jgi:uncharacterized protein
LINAATSSEWSKFISPKNYPKGGKNARDQCNQNGICQARKPDRDAAAQACLYLRRVRALGAMRFPAERQLHRDVSANRTRGREIEDARYPAAVAGQLGLLSWLSFSPMFSDLKSAPSNWHAGMSAETAMRVAAFLDAHHVVSLATCGPDGPHAANVLYARDGLALLWISDPTSRHSTDVEADARVAATVAPDYVDIDDIRGVQICGHARAITGASHRANAQRLLEARYPCVKQLSHAPPALREAYARVELYRLDPCRVVLIDNSRGFGHKDTLDLEKLPPDRTRKPLKQSNKRLDVAGREAT